MIRRIIESVEKAEDSPSEEYDKLTEVLYDEGWEMDDEGYWTEGSHYSNYETDPDGVFWEKWSHSELPGTPIDLSWEDDGPISVRVSGSNEDIKDLTPESLRVFLKGLR